MKISQHLSVVIKKISVSLVKFYTGIWLLLGRNIYNFYPALFFRLLLSRNGLRSLLPL